ncbi:DUF397 domain-containing protein [Actinomadura craniellae]|uniref:DUF397 domain-containing protein n=1 Tax=Actinomadura craniellae TaxID=2231787 RepID=A0A365HA16_9ACTN|nr:DUF397 domain-containing protein [Actinomadura craniellae]RAY15980.1 DUF397 domain-containing protein [Actinomadura craniellae]
MSQPVWRKSSHSNTSGGECVEVARLSMTIRLRDSKNPGIGYLSISPREFADLLARVKRGRLL